MDLVATSAQTDVRVRYRWGRVLVFAAIAFSVVPKWAGCQCVMSDKEVIERVDAYAKAGDVKGLVKFADELHTFHHHTPLLQDIIQRWPIKKHLYRLRAMLHAGISWHLAGDNDKARAHWEQLTKEYAFSEPADEARLWLASLDAPQ